MMRVLFVVILTGCLVVPAAAGQPKPMSFALKGGVAPAFQELDPNRDNRDGNLIGFGGGATLGMNFGPSFALDTDFLYVRKGGQYKDVYRNGNGVGEQDRVFKNRLALDYIVVNPMFRIAPDTRGAHPYIMAGPEFGFLTKAQWTYESDLGTSTQDATDGFKSTDFGINVGGGLEVPASGSASLFFEGRYSIGMTDINDTAAEDGGGSARNRSIFGFAGIRF